MRRASAIVGAIDLSQQALMHFAEVLLRIDDVVERDVRGLFFVGQSKATASTALALDQTSRHQGLQSLGQE